MSDIGSVAAGSVALCADAAGSFAITFLFAASALYRLSMKASLDISSG